MQLGTELLRCLYGECPCSLREKRTPIGTAVLIKLCFEKHPCSLREVDARSGLPCSWSLVRKASIIITRGGCISRL